MKELKTLFLMQIKEKLNTSFLKDRKQTLLKVVFAVLQFAAVTAIAFFIFWICRYLNLFSPLNYLPVSVVAVVFMAVFLFSVISCTFSLSKALFYSDDNTLLATLPVQSDKIFLSKIMVYYLHELKRTVFFIVPIFYAYALLSSASVFAYIWIPLIFVIFTGAEVFLSALLAIPVYYFLRFFNAFAPLKYFLICAVLTCVILLVVYLINSIPEDINLIKSWVKVSAVCREFLSWFCDKFFVFYAFALCMCGKYSNFSNVYFTEYTYIVPLILLAVIVVLFVADVVIYHLCYTKITVRQFEYNKKRIKRQKNNVKHSGFLSGCIYETKRSLRSSGTLASDLAAIIVTPLVILLLNSVYAAISTRLIGKYMTMAFNVLIVMLFVTSANVNVSSVYSRDGDAFAINKSKPVKPLLQVVPKLSLSFIKTIIIVVSSCAIFTYMSDISAADSVLVTLGVLLVAISHILWSAEIDFLNPRPQIFKISGAAGVNPNEVKSIIISFVLSLAAMGIVIFFLMDASSHVYLRIFAFAAVFFAYRAGAFCFKAKTLFNDGDLQ